MWFPAHEKSSSWYIYSILSTLSKKDIYGLAVATTPSEKNMKYFFFILQSFFRVSPRLFVFYLFIKFFVGNDDADDNNNNGKRSAEKKLQQKTERMKIIE